MFRIRLGGCHRGTVRGVDPTPQVPRLLPNLRCAPRGRWNHTPRGWGASGFNMLQRSAVNSLIRRVLVVDNEVAATTNAAVRSVRALVSELQARAIEVVEANSYEDGLATVVSDSGIHCLLLDWTTGRNDRTAQSQATGLLRSVRKRNARLPVFLLASRDLAGSVSVEVA